MESFKRKEVHLQSFPFFPSDEIREIVGFPSFFDCATATARGRIDFNRKRNCADFDFPRNMPHC